MESQSNVESEQDPVPPQVTTQELSVLQSKYDPAQEPEAWQSCVQFVESHRNVELVQEEDPEHDKSQESVVLQLNFTPVQVPEA